MVSLVTSVHKAGTEGADYVPVGPAAPAIYDGDYLPGQQMTFRALSPTAKHNSDIYHAMLPEGDLVLQVSAANTAKIKMNPVHKGYAGKLKANGLLDPNVIFGDRQGWVSFDVTQVP